jgi:hypothetical protein
MASCGFFLPEFKFCLGFRDKLRANLLASGQAFLRFWFFSMNAITPTIRTANKKIGFPKKLVRLLHDLINKRFIAGFYKGKRSTKSGVSQGTITALPTFKISINPAIMLLRRNLRFIVKFYTNELLVSSKVSSNHEATHALRPNNPGRLAHSKWVYDQFGKGCLHFFMTIYHSAISTSQAEEN